MPPVKLGQRQFLAAHRILLARGEPASFDLVVLCDVLHHVPPPERQPLLSAIDHVMTAGVVGC